MGIESTCDDCGKTTDEIYCASCKVDADCDCDTEVRNDLSDEISGDLVEDLSAAIRRGDRDEAELLLDQIASHVDAWPEHVSLGRYGWKAKRAA